MRKHSKSIFSKTHFTLKRQENQSHTSKQVMLQIWASYFLQK